MATLKQERPTLPDYTAHDSYEIWYFDGKQWNWRGSRADRNAAVQLAQAMGYPFWAVILCSRTVEINTVED